MSTASVQVFEMEGADGGPLRGEVQTSGGGKGRPPVVLCHGWKGFKTWGFFPYLAERLAKAGFTAVSFNFSSCGVGPDGDGFTEPERFAKGTFSGDLEDLGTVCSALIDGSLIESLGPADRYGLFGYSRGGGTALLHGCEHADTAALVTWSAISHAHRWDEGTVGRWRAEGRRIIPDAWTGEKLVMHTDMLDDVEANCESLNIMSAAARVGKPWLIIHGDADEFIPVGEANELYGAGGEATTKLEVIAGGTHTFGVDHPFVGSSEKLDTAIDRTVAWFSRHLF